jgi:hypothetical protein
MTYDNNSTRQQLEAAIEQSRRFLRAPHDTSTWLPPTPSQFVAQLQSGPMPLPVQLLTPSNPRPADRSTMKVVCPFAGDVHPRTAEALEAQSSRVEFVDVVGSPVAYWELVVRLWDEQEDFLLVEHDVVLAPGTIKRLESCPGWWCSCPPASGHIYAIRIPTDGDGWKAAHLLANRFRRELMIALPTLVRDIPKGGRHWTCLDVGMLEPLDFCGADVHIHHDAPVQHLGTAKTPLAFVRQVISWVDYLGCVDGAAQADAAAREFLPNIEALCKIRDIPIPAESVESDPRLRLTALLASVIENETQNAGNGAT